MVTYPAPWMLPPQPLSQSLRYLLVHGGGFFHPCLVIAADDDAVGIDEDLVGRE